METNDYSKFKILKGNRQISWAKTQRLVKSIELIGYIKSHPILVDKKLTIIDGQHRFAACKQLGLPVLYEVHDNTENIGDVLIALNANQQSWQLSDYIHYYASKGIEFYTECLAFEDRHKLTISHAIHLCCLKRAETKQIRAGVDIKLDPERNDVAEFLLLFKELPFYLTVDFVGAIKVSYPKLKKLPKKDLAKLTNNAGAIRQQALQVQYYTVFENILNKGKHGDSKVSLS